GRDGGVSRGPLRIWAARVESAGSRREVGGPSEVGGRGGWFNHDGSQAADRGGQGASERVGPRDRTGAPRLAGREGGPRTALRGRRRTERRGRQHDRPSRLAPTLTVAAITDRDQLILV